MSKNVEKQKFPVRTSVQTNFLLVKITLPVGCPHLLGPDGPQWGPIGPHWGPIGPQWAPMGPNRAPWGPIGPNWGPMGPKTWKMRVLLLCWDHISQAPLVVVVKHPGCLGCSRAEYLNPKIKKIVISIESPFRTHVQ